MDGRVEISSQTQMIKVKFLQDFQGVETKGLFYRNNHEYELDDSIALRMVADKRAVCVSPAVTVEVEYQPPMVEVTESAPIENTEQQSKQVEEVYQPTAKKRGRK